jgi:hypothetical protein
MNIGFVKAFISSVHNLNSYFFDDIFHSSARETSLMETEKLRFVLDYRKIYRPNSSSYDRTSVTSAYFYWSRHSSVCVTTSYWLECRVLIPGTETDFSLRYHVQTECAALWLKRPGHEADHSTTSNALVKNTGVVPPILRFPIRLHGSVLN